VDAFSTADQPVPPGSPVSFDATLVALGINPGNAGVGTFTVAASGVYQVTVALQGNTDILARLSVNGVFVGPSVHLSCSNESCTFTRLLGVAAGGVIRLVNDDASSASVGTHSGITIVRIA
jgi:hypothetical protein